MVGRGDCDDGQEAICSTKAGRQAGRQAGRELYLETKNLS